MQLAVNINGFNRPGHLHKTLEALKDAECNLDVWIHLDGPRNCVDESACSECLEVARNFTATYSHNGFISTSERNKGLAESIIESVEARLAKYDFVIFLEDDIIVTSAFFDYMEAAARKYQNCASVMQISGFNYATGDTARHAYFLPFTTSWGWGTWPRAWKYYDRNVSSWVRYFAPVLRRAAFDLGCGFYKQITANYAGRMKTWAVFWYATVFREGGVVLYPSSSLVSNIGHDGSGENCKPSRGYGIALQRQEGSSVKLPDEIKTGLWPLCAFLVRVWMTRVRNVLSWQQT